jgi:hypothetical protein
MKFVSQGFLSFQYSFNPKCTVRLKISMLENAGLKHPHQNYYLKQKSIEKLTFYITILQP